MAYFFEATCTSKAVEELRTLPSDIEQFLLIEVWNAGKMRQRETKIEECQREEMPSHRLG